MMAISLASRSHRTPLANTFGKFVWPAIATHGGKSYASVAFEIQSGRIDCIITDPPYQEELLMRTGFRRINVVPLLPGQSLAQD